MLSTPARHRSGVDTTTPLTAEDVDAALTSELRAKRKKQLSSGSSGATPEDIEADQQARQFARRLSLNADDDDDERRA